MTAELQAAARFLERHPAEAARILDRQEPKEVLAVMQELPADLAATALARLTGNLGAGCVALMESDAAGGILARMPAEDAARLVRRMRSEDRDRLLERIPLSQRQGVRRLLEYAEDMIGALMEPSPPTLQESMSVAEAARSLATRSTTTEGVIYVVDHEQRLTGTVTKAAIAAAPETARVGDLASAVAATLSPHHTVGSALSQAAWMEVDELPVVNLDRVLEGSVAHRQLRAWSGSRARGEREDPLTAALGVVELMWVGLFGLMETIAVEEEP